MIKDSCRRIREWWLERTGKQQLGYGFTALAVVLTLLLALLRGTTSLSTGWVLSLAILGILAQAASAFSFGNVGKADPSHAEASVRHLIRLNVRSTNTALTAQQLYEAPDLYNAGDPRESLSEIQRRMGVVSAELSWIAEDAAEAIHHWDQFFPQAVTKAKERGEQINDQQPADHDNSGASGE
ncbi:hypothetical protein [Williamsia sp. D3]|uniref:hypothetical protein n=1 Tax=Williamsia sp. D3 TaxID=1313067 RepID=UPI0003D2F0A9|nr:hypothetical protein [Williamsia sp. D3]ETD30186.1 hypothetical protein W823_26260 [Williamsia sp. D3]